jgi:hypothetical protein
VIYDCFPFFNELDLLEIRLSEMSASVDCFVLAEAPLTFQGQPKPLMFHENRARFRRYLPKIRHLVVDDMPLGEQPSQWTREYHQRDALKRALTDAADDDLVLISDADEILRGEAIQEARSRAAFTFFDVDFYNYYLDWKVVDWPVGPWIKPYAAPWHIVRDMPDLSRPRAIDPLAYLSETGRDPQTSIVRKAGWHFSWLGGPQRMVEKLAAFSHTEAAVVAWRDPLRLAKEIDRKRFFYNGAALTTVPVDETFPALVRNNHKEYRRRGLLSPESRDSAGRFSEWTRFLKRPR